MTVWSKSVSWSKFDMALKCPLKLQKTIDKEYSPRFGASSRAASMGKLVQRVFELYFNRDMNLATNGQREVVLHRILERVVADPKMAEELTVDKTFIEEAQPQLSKGFVLFGEQGLLNYRVRSEVKLATVFQGFRLFGMLDFLAEVQGLARLYDGKGNSNMDADPRQVLYYGLGLHAAGKKLGDGGFLYWKHGYDPVDLTPKALYEFIHGDFARGRKVFDRLKVGVDVLEHNPTPEHCNFCNWKKTCKHSVYYIEPGSVQFGVEEVSF